MSSERTDPASKPKVAWPALWLPPVPSAGSTTEYPFACPGCNHVLGRALESAGGGMVGDRVLPPTVLHSRLPGLVRISPPGEVPPRYGTRRMGKRGAHSPLRHALVRGALRDEAGHVFPIHFGADAFQTVEPVFIVMCTNCRRRVLVDVERRPRLSFQ